MESPDCLDVFLEGLEKLLPHPAQRQAFAAYVVGLTSPLERKSMEPIATRARPDAPDAAHQALHHFISHSRWDDARVRRYGLAWGLWAATAYGPIERCVIDDTGALKQGVHSVGVARQYTGTAGKIANCQITVTLAVCGAQHTVPVDLQLYLPEAWTDDPARRAAARIPEGVLFEPKWRLALDMLARAQTHGVPVGRLVLADADYGRVAGFRSGVLALGLAYGVGVHKTQALAERGQVRTAAQLAAQIPPNKRERIWWRDGTKGPLSSTFARRWVRVADAGSEHAAGRGQWLLIEWREGEPEPRFYLCTLPRTTRVEKLVYEIKERYRTEQMNEEIKGELGFDHFEGRSWPGWNHHATIVLCCYHLLLAHRALAFPPSRPPRGSPRRRSATAAHATHCAHGAAA